MKKYLLIFAILITKICAGQSTAIDTLCFPVPVIQKVLIAAEQKKVLEQQITILNDRIKVKEDIIKQLTDKDAETVARYEAEIKVYKEEKTIYEDQLKGYERLLKREKRKRFWATASGVITTGLMTYLFITK